MDISRKIPEQLDEVEAEAPPELAFQMAIQPHPHGLARLVCWLGFHELGAVSHTKDGIVHIVTYCDRCGRVVSIVQVPEDE